MFPPEKDGAMTRVTMQIRHGAGPAEVRRADTQALRDEFLVERLFVPGEVRMVYSTCSPRGRWGSWCSAAPAG
jgi:hypothetical protein